MLSKTAKVDHSREVVFAKQIYNLIKEENVAVVIAATQFILKKIDSKAFHTVVKRQSRQSSQLIQSPREKSNKEFHYTVFKGILSIFDNEEVKSYLRNLKYLFLHEDKFILGSYARTALKAVISPTTDAQLKFEFAELEEDLRMMVRVFQDKKGSFFLPNHLRTKPNQANLDDDEVIRDPQFGLGEEEQMRLHKVIYFNNSGLLHNLFCRYQRKEMDKFQLLKALRTYSTMYEDLNS